jgi:AraC-like DNA-binding protein
MGTLPDTPQFWRPLPGIELMSAHWVRHSFSKHFHDCYTIGINDAGCGSFDCGGARHYATPGALNLIAPGETHTGQAAHADGWSYRDFYIDAACMEGAPDFPSAVVQDAELARKFRLTFDLLRKIPSSRLEQEYHLLQAIRRLCDRHSTIRTSSEPLEDRGRIVKVRDYLHAHFDRNVSTEELARVAGWSRYHTIRAFHHQAGLPPHAYQNIVRVNEARRLLRRGASIADAAISTGFCDQSHMHHIFRRVAGTTPGQYKRAISSKTWTESHADTGRVPTRVSVFFYGSFIDLNVLAKTGYHPDHISVARLDGFDIVVRPLATLIPSADQSVYGILTTATHHELAELYGQDWVRDYLPEAVIVTTNDGTPHPALCYIAHGRTSKRPFENYLERIRTAAPRLGFPQSYLDRLDRLT